MSIPSCCFFKKPVYFCTDAKIVGSARDMGRMAMYHIRTSGHCLGTTSC